MTALVVREATEPPEARGITRDAVRMMVAYRHDLSLVHGHAHDLPQFLDEGDLIVVNTSGTLAAATTGPVLMIGVGATATRVDGPAVVAFRTAGAARYPTARAATTAATWKTTRPTRLGRGRNSRTRRRSVSSSRSSRVLRRNSGVIVASGSVPRTVQRSSRRPISRRQLSQPAR